MRNFTPTKITVMKKQFILRENVLTDNILEIPEKSYIFKGGYIAILKENTFLNAWQDKETIKKFKKESSLRKYLAKNYTKEEYKDLDFYGTCLDN